MTATPQACLQDETRNHSIAENLEGVDQVGESFVSPNRDHSSPDFDNPTVNGASTRSEMIERYRIENHRLELEAQEMREHKRKADEARERFLVEIEVIIEQAKEQSVEVDARNLQEELLRSETSKVRDEMVALRAENARMKEELRNSQARASALQYWNGELERARFNAVSDLQLAHGEIENMRREAVLELERQEIAREKLQESNRCQQKLRQERQRAVDFLDQARITINLLNSDMNTLQGQLKDAGSRQTTLENELAEWRERDEIRKKQEEKEREEKEKEEAKILEESCRKMAAMIKEEEEQRQAAAAARKAEEKARKKLEEKEREKERRRKAWNDATVKEKLRCQKKYEDPWSVGRWSDRKALDRFKALIKDFPDTKFSDAQPLTAGAIPWPVLDSPMLFKLEDLTSTKIQAFWKHVSLVHNANEYKTLIKKAKCMLHPDAWRKRNLLVTVMDDTLRQSLEGACLEVSQITNEFASRPNYGW